MNDENFARFRISTLKPEHIPFIEAIENAVGLPFWGEDTYRRFLEGFTEYFGFCLISEADDERLIGFSLARSTLEDMELLKIGVAPEFRRLGFGTGLMEETFAEGLRRGAARCFLEVRKSNQKAIQFYSAHNFRISGVRRNYYSNPVEDAWIMERIPKDGVPMPKM